MFRHNFRYTFKILLKNKMLLFWTLAFPLILGTFFSLAFSNIENSEKLTTIDIAVVNNETFKENSLYQLPFETLGNDASKNQLFKVKYASEKTAKKLLDQDKIVGYVIFENNDKATTVIKENGINQTILSYVVEEILQTEDIMKNMAIAKVKKPLTFYPNDASNLESLYTKIYQRVLKTLLEDNIQIQDITTTNLSYTMIEFYTLIAMTCLYGGILGMFTINWNLANMSATGKRMQVGPTSKTKLILSSVAASYIVQLLGLVLLFVYTVFVLHINYGDNLGLIILLALVGSFAGLSLGVAIACCCKGSDNTKTGIIIGFSMLGCFFAGMMGITMKYIVDKNIPLLNKINPASMITDGFYSLYYYDTLQRYVVNVISLLIFAIIMLAISMFSLRRQKYDSI